jgi:outer membrane receptor protein involved in Fe transport
MTNFNSENTTNGIGKPESARQYEGGLRFTFLNEKIVLTSAVFNVSRDNVATIVTGVLPNGQELIDFDSQITNGVEASLQAKITDQWSILANATHQEAVVTPPRRHSRPSAIIRRACRPTWPMSGAPTNSRSAACRASRSASAPTIATRPIATPPT